jgi:hypothetical protein
MPPIRDDLVLAGQRGIFWVHRDLSGGRRVNFLGEEMAGQAGWYRAPGEAGVLRYWNGTIWTDHRQPAPAAKPESVEAHVSTPVVAHDTVSDEEITPDEDSPEEDSPDVESNDLDADELDPMAEYERQFARAPEFARTPARQPKLQPQLAGRPAFVGSDLASQPAPLAGPRRPTIPTSSRLTLAAPVTVVSAPTVPTPVLTEPETTVEPVLAAASVLSSTPAAGAPLVESPAADGDADEPVVADPVVEEAVVADPRRTGVLRALIGLGAGILIVLVGLGLMAGASSSTAVASGEARGSGVVTSLGSTAHDSCTPIARFAVGGKSYTAISRTAISPCPVDLGRTVDVIYSVANPESTARVQLGSPFAQFAWLVPVLGGLLFLGSLFVFIVKAGSIVGGIALIRDGRKRRTPATDA